MRKKTLLPIFFLTLVTALLPLIYSGAAHAQSMVAIYDIQGSDQRSPYEGETVTTSGVVTLISANGRDMWIQDPAGDGNPSTSDGIAVTRRDSLPDPKPEVGDLVRITAEVDEQQYGNALPLTRLVNPDVDTFEILSIDNPLPPPVALVDLPNFSIPEGEDFWEPLEGMLVSVVSGLVVAPTSSFGEFAMLTEADADADLGSGYFAQTKQILIQGLGDNLVDYNPERILVDDDSIDDAIVVRPGDTVHFLVGVVDYTFGAYKLQPAVYEVETQKLPKPPVSKRSGGSGNLTITTFNLDNLFDLVLNTPTNIDVFGQVGFDPGTQWGPPDTANNTLRRKPDVCQGDTNETDSFDPAVEWLGYGEDEFSNLGDHTVTCGPTDDLIISEYVEGSSYNKAIEIYNGTGQAVNLATEGYAIDIYFNGSTLPGTTIQLSGILADGDAFVVAQDNAHPDILGVADQTTAAILFSGDDTIVLRKGGKDDVSSTPTPDELEIKLSKLALAIQLELELPEVIVVQEIENRAIAQQLADLVNGMTATSYVATSFETSDSRGIEPGFLWDSNRVTLLDAFQLNDEIVPGVSDAFGLSSPSPGREPIVGVFSIEGYTITIIGNHFKSKSGDDPLFGVYWPPIRITEVQRKAQAQVVRDYVNLLLSADSEALVMVTGDLNDFQFGEPGEGLDHPIAILEGGPGEVPLTNLIDLEKAAETYTFIYDGNSQVLDHMLVSPALCDLFKAVDILHFNASFPVDVGNDPSTALRASDHDPLEGRFKFK